MSCSGKIAWLHIVDVECILAQAERLFASFSNFYFTNYNIKSDYFYSQTYSAEVPFAHT